METIGSSENGVRTGANHFIVRSRCVCGCTAAAYHRSPHIVNDVDPFTRASVDRASTEHLMTKPQLAIVAACRPFLRAKKPKGSTRRSARSVCMLLAFMVTFLVSMSGCDGAGPEPFEEEVIVESYQIAGEPVAPVRLSRSIPLDETYSPGDAAVRGATVEIDALADDGSVHTTISMVEAPDSAGFYLPAGRLDTTGAAPPVPVVEPLQTYRLRVETAAGASLRSTTTVPDTFSIVSVSQDTATYLADEEVGIRITASQTPGRDQAFYIFSTESLDPVEENLVPLVGDFLEEDENTVIDDVVITSSPILNEAGYTANPDGTFTLRLPWVLVAFFGPNRTRINVLDANMYDFVRSQTAQQGGGGFTPGAIPNVIETVDGGGGLFGSMASVRYDVYVEE